MKAFFAFSVSCVTRKYLGLGLALALLAAYPHAAIAEKPKSPLQLGASTGQVLTSWGEPVEKIERGLKHEVVWSYPQGAFVTFKKGQVVSYRIAGGQVVDAHTQSQQIAAQQTVAAAPTEVIAGSTRDLVRDIAKELPSSPDTPYTEPPAQVGRGTPRNPPPPPAMIPGDVEADIEDEG